MHLPIHFDFMISLQVRNATAVFIINLSLSDLLFCCFNLPLAASTFWNRAWTHGELLCRLYPLLRYGLLAVSLFTVLAITINRYVMIGHPRIYPRLVILFSFCYFNSILGMKKMRIPISLHTQQKFDCFQ